MAFTLGSQTFEMREKFILELHEEKLTDAGLEAVATLLIPHAELRLTTGECWCSSCITDKLQYIGGITWLGVDNKTYQGTMPKRIAKKFKRDYNIVLPSTIVEQIGTVARANMSEVVRHTCDITDVIDWDDGEFGDSDSCWWGGNSGARDVLTKHGGLALRFYENNGEGIGRCWLVPNAPQAGMAVIFNSYWGSGSRASNMDKKDSQLINFAIMLSAHTGLDYRKLTDLRNCGEADGLMWINNHAGYVIGEKALIRALPNKYDLRMATPEHQHECRHCQIPVRIGAFSIRNGGEIEEVYACYECRNEHYIQCAHCSWRMLSGSSTHNVDGNLWCEDCYQQHTAVCGECGERHNASLMREVYQAAMRVCPTCAVRHYRCSECNVLHGENTETFGYIQRRPCPRCQAAVAERDRTRSLILRLRRHYFVPEFRTLSALKSWIERYYRTLLFNGQFTGEHADIITEVFGQPFAEVLPQLQALLDAPTQPMLPDMNLPEVVDAFRTAAERETRPPQTAAQIAYTRTRDAVRERLRQEAEQRAANMIALDDEEVPF